MLRPCLVFLAHIPLLIGAHQPAPQRLTTVPQGTIHVERNRLIDSRGHEILIRGTGLPEFRTDAAARNVVPAQEFGPHSATIFSTIRQRWNMNAVRLPLSLADFEREPRYLEAAAGVVRSANEFELLVILASGEPSGASMERRVRLWRECATVFRANARVMFELDAEPLVAAVRGAGAKQVVVVRTGVVNDANAIHLVEPRYATTRTDRDRDRQFGQLAERVPVMARDLDPHLNESSGECAGLPADPSEAEAMVDANLDYFDAHGISWIVSEFRPGKLIVDYRRIFGTSLENGWTCGQDDRAPFGIGEVVQFHLWGGEMRGLFAVSAAGSFLLPRGSVAILYGGIFAERDSRSYGSLPTELGKVSLRITDSKGVERRAGLLFVSEGWGQANFVVPPGCALGPARITVDRRDGTSASTAVTIVDVAPGLWSATADGRGPVIGFVKRAVGGGAMAEVPIYRSDSQGSYTIPIRASASGLTTVRLLGSGFRRAARLSDIEVKMGGVRVPVVSYGPSDGYGVDQLTVRIPASLRGAGEVDLMCFVEGHVSNVVRINIGSAERAR